MQILEHLCLMETVIAMGIFKELSNDQSEPASSKPIHLAVNRNTKVEAPSFVMPSDDFTSLEAITKKLSESRKTLIQVTEGISPEDMEQKSFPHPIFGPLSIKQWIPFVGFHEKRHLAQIEELKEALLF